MQLIYLSAANDIKIINKFIAKYQETPLCKAVTPTLSPEGPGLPGLVGGTQGGVGSMTL